MPLNPSRVSVIAGGDYLVDGRFYVPRSEAGPSLDGRYHGCFPTPAQLKCFFAPLPEG